MAAISFPPMPKLSPLANRLRASGTPGKRNDPVAGVIWVTLAMAVLAGLAASGKLANQMGVHPFQVVFYRNFSCLLLLLPLLAWRGSGLLHSRRPSLYWVRGGLSFVAMTTWFSALAMIPLAELTAISFLAPMFGTLFAAVFLREAVRGRRITALAVGFIGAMVILRPGVGEFSTGQILALVSTFVMGMIGPLVKQQTQIDEPDKIVFLTTLVITPLSLVPALFVWQWPGLELLPVLFTMGLCAVLGHIALVRGFSSTDASLVFTFEFSRLPFAAAVGWLMFGEPTDVWTWVGATIIFAAAIYITRREAEIARGGGGRRPADAVDPLLVTPVPLRY